MEFISNCYEDTINFATKFASSLKGGEVIVLSGDLGAGKTVFAKGLLIGLGSDAIVTSPTFTIMNIYDARLKFYHFDMYRLESEDELVELGFDEFIGSKGSVSAIEWAERVPSLLPSSVIKVEIIKLSDDKRKIVVNK